MKKKLIAIILVLACIFCMMAGVTASADEQEPLSLTVVCEHDGTVIGGMEWQLFKVADRTISGTYELTGNFSGYDVSLEDTSASALTDAASTLANYVVTDSIEEDCSATGNEEGIVLFEGDDTGALSNGIYLVIGSPIEKNGKKYTPAPMLVELAAWSDDNAQLSVYAKFTVEDVPVIPEDTEYSVTKVWDDEEQFVKYRPSAVTVEIYCDGTVKETVVLSQDNDWTYSWSDNEGHTWRVKETDVPEYYHIVYRSNESEFVIVNTFDVDLYKNSNTIEGEPTPTPPEGEKLPQTGQLWWPVPVLALAGIILVVLGFRFIKTDEK
ncbi:MAG: Cna B-type domain-containing protein [Lachnospiraceae bacterium]